LVGQALLGLNVQELASLREALSFCIGDLDEYDTGLIVWCMARLQGSIAPDFAFDWKRPYEEYDAKVQKWLEDLKSGYRKLAKGDLVGETVRFQIADGYAQYMIVKERPFTVAHLDILDGYSALGATIRGYRLQDARAQVEADRRWQQLRREKEAAYEKLLKDNEVLHYHDGFGQYIRCEVVVADHDGHTIKKGEQCLKEAALVGAWRDYDLRADSYHMKGVREGRLMKPHISNLYEYSEDLQRRHPDPRKLEPLQVEGQMELFAG